MDLLRESDVESVYSGRPGCCCGCRGKHSTSPVSIKRVVARINAELADAESFDGLVALDTELPGGPRRYIAYLKTGL